MLTFWFWHNKFLFQTHCHITWNGWNRDPNTQLSFFTQDVIDQFIVTSFYIIFCFRSQIIWVTRDLEQHGPTQQATQGCVEQAPQLTTHPSLRPYISLPMSWIIYRLSAQPVKPKALNNICSVLSILHRASCCFLNSSSKATILHVIKVIKARYALFEVRKGQGKTCWSFFFSCPFLFCHIFKILYLLFFFKTIKLLHLGNCSVHTLC